MEINEQIYEKYCGNLLSCWRCEASKECHAIASALICTDVLIPLLICGLLILQKSIICFINVLLFDTCWVFIL